MTEVELKEVDLTALQKTLTKAIYECAKAMHEDRYWYVRSAHQSTDVNAWDASAVLDMLAESIGIPDTNDVLDELLDEEG